MALQTQNLVMIGLGVKSDTPPPYLVQPRLVDGIHLRWGFKRDLGFPWYGYYLFYRLHRKGRPLYLSKAIRRLPVGLLKDTSISLPCGDLSSDSTLLLTSDFSSAGKAEFDLKGRRYLYFHMPPGELARRVEVHIGFRADARIQVTAFLHNMPVVQNTLKGRANEIITANLEFDAITAVKVESGPAVMIDLGYVPVSQEATEGWTPVPKFPQPMCLPISHPDYPCCQQAEDFETSRIQAIARILYGDPADIVLSPPPIYDSGTVSVSNDSAIVTGSGTHWKVEFIGSTLQVDGDSTVYTIIQVIGPQKLVLSRNYSRATRNGASYEILSDTFGQLHDNLVQLVAGGMTAGPMAFRFLPAPIYNTGNIDLKRNSPTISGNNTQWTPELAGLSLQVVCATTGSVSVETGYDEITGVGTHWTSALNGKAMRISGDRETYLISRVLSPTKLVLNQLYTGIPGGDKAYIVSERTTYTVLRVDSPTQLTLDRPYRGRGGTGKKYCISSVLQPSPSTADNPRMPELYPLDLVLLGSLHPAIAQMVGLYWVDQTVEPDVAYDYLIISDQSGQITKKFGAEMKDFFRWLEETNFSQVDGYIVFNKRMTPAPLLSAPQDLKVYALPDSSIQTQDGGTQNGRCNAGLCWDRGVINVGAQQVLLPNRPVMYHLWRVGPRDTKPNSPPLLGDYYLLTEQQPLLVTEPRMPPGMTLQRPPDWPPFPLHTIDTGLKEGWYSYQVNGVDVFGRYSPRSEPATWYQWTPIPDPCPWYYKDKDSPTDAVVHSFAVRLLAKMPPPPPTAIEAYALDPADPFIVKDEAYQTWWGALTASEWYQALSESQRKNLIGLRVRWQWTEAHMRQAPDAHEFRVYYQPDRLNALVGLTVKISPVSATESDVTTDIPNADIANDFKGGWLRIGSYSFRIMSSDATNPLRVRVENLGLSYDEGAIEVTSDSATITGIGTNWHAGMAGLSIQISGEPMVYKILAVQSPEKITLDQIYTGATGSGKTYVIFDLRPRENALCTLILPPELATDYSQATNWQERFHVVSFNEHVKEVTDETGRKYRQYEIFLPDPDSQLHDGLPLATSLETPIVYAQIGITASDDKEHTADDLKWAHGHWGGRFGNEGPVGPPVTIFRVNRKAPLPPEPPPDSEKVFATPADYHGHSYYTYRWKPLRDPGPPPKILPVRCHIFRALDNAVFKADWLIRTTRKALDPSNPQHSYIFPPSWSLNAKQTAANQLNSITSVDGYADLSNDALTLLARLPGNESVPPGSTLQQRDWTVRKTRLDLAADDTVYFPSEWGELKRQTVADELNTIDSFEAYNGLSNDGQRVQAGHPGNERAFTQLTIQPLDPADPANANRAGPDNPPDFDVDPELRAYVDTLDGYTTNRYFYRSAYVDGANNRSTLSISSPPVWLPNVIPPRSPVFTKVLGGDRQITLKWASNREPDLSEYRMYRADSESAARDIRLMTLMHTEVVPAGDPAARPAEVVWTDTSALGFLTYYFRVVAVSDSDYISAPSRVIVARAYDQSPPEPSIWQKAEWVKLDQTGEIHTWSEPIAGYSPAVVLAWSAHQPGLKCLVQRKVTGADFWASISAWFETAAYDPTSKEWLWVFYDRTVSEDTDYVYRVKQVNATGQITFSDEKVAQQG